MAAGDKGRIDRICDEAGLLLIHGQAHLPANKRGTRARGTLWSIVRHRPDGEAYLRMLLKLILWSPVNEHLRLLPNPMLRAVDDVCWEYREHFDEMPNIFRLIDLQKLYGEAKSSRVLSTRQKMADLLEQEIKGVLEP